MGVLTLPVGIADAVRRAETGRVDDHPYLRVAAADRDPDARPLIVVPGLNDPLMRVTGTPWYAALMALFGRRYADERPVYLVSRPYDGPESVRGMALGYAPVLDRLGPVDAMGLSMGGFLVAELAAERPDLVDRVVFGLAAGALSEAGRERVLEWLTLAREEDWPALFRDAYGVVATGATLHTLRVGGRLYDTVAPGPESPTDFLREANACLAYEGWDRLGDLRAPALVVGGTDDPFFSVEGFRRTARLLPQADLATLRGVGHEAALMHAEAFDGVLARFFATRPS